MPTPSIVIFGGAGFLGSRISQAALRKGWRVTCISRTGRPNPGVEEKEETSWHEKVEWTKGDATLPETYTSALERATHVVSTIGVLDYRGVRRESRPSRVLDKLASTLYDATMSSLSPGHHTSRALDVYDRINVTTNETIAQVVSRLDNKVASFLYVSAAAGFPGIPAQYLSTKRRAETSITTILRDVPARTIFLRPGFMFDEGGGVTKGIARAIGLSYALNSSLDGKLSLLGAAGVKPLAVDRVASAVVEACDDTRVSGPVEIHQIEALADVRWRAEMIV